MRVFIESGNKFYEIKDKALAYDTNSTFEYIKANYVGADLSKMSPDIAEPVDDLEFPIDARVYFKSVDRTYSIPIFENGAATGEYVQFPVERLPDGGKCIPEEARAYCHNQQKNRKRNRRKLFAFCTSGRRDSVLTFRGRLPILRRGDISWSLQIINNHNAK